MTGWLVSLLMGLGVGVAYGLLNVRSPAPPLVALVGLLGIVLGEQAVGAAKHHFVPTAQASIRQAIGYIHECGFFASVACTGSPSTVQAAAAVPVTSGPRRQTVRGDAGNTLRP